MAKTQQPARVLSIAGTDPTGGAGIQADLKAIAAADGFGMSVVTALVAQNTQGVRSIHLPPVEFLREQLDAVLDDVDVDAVKIGMLSNTAIADVVREYLPRFGDVPVVLDPVMVASSNDRLLDAEAEDAVRELCQYATVITPNLKELAVLTQNDEADDFDVAIEQAQAWADKHNTAIIVKGGHLRSDIADNAVVRPNQEPFRVPSPRVDTNNTHGTGCSLSSALATRLGAGDDLERALTWSTNWLHEAIANADALHVGKGNGPVDHFHRSRRLQGGAELFPVAVVTDENNDGVAASRNISAEAETSELPAPKLEAPGPHTQRMWDVGEQYFADIQDLSFIQQLGQGTLNREDFRFYLQQDSFYLDLYSKSLARLAGMARNQKDQLHWAQGAAECISVEADLHRTELNDDSRGSHVESDTAAILPSRVTRAYTDFLSATTHTDDYVVGIGAVLPCYWLYAEVGLHLFEQNHPGHPFEEWLDMYGGQDFLDDTRRALDIAERALADASPETRRRAEQAYAQAAFYEVEFFDQAHRR